MRAEKQLTRITEHNAKICEKQVPLKNIMSGRGPVTFGRVAMWTVGPIDGTIFGRKATFARNGVHAKFSEVRRTGGAYGKIEAILYMAPCGWKDVTDGPS